MVDLNALLANFSNGIIFGFVLTFILGGISWGFWFLVSFFRNLTKHV